MESSIKKMHNIWKPTGWVTKSWKQVKTCIVLNAQKMWKEKNWKS